MPNTRPIPKVDPKVYADPGYLTIKPGDDGKSVYLELHHCSVYMSESEALTTLLSLSNAGLRVWGNNFLRKFLTYVEIL